MKLVYCFVLSLAPLAAVVYAAYNAAGDYRDYSPCYIEAAWYAQQRAVAPAVPYCVSPAAIVNPYNIYMLSSYEPVK